MSDRIRVQLLGPVRASDGNGPVSLRGRTARTVLAQLALSAGNVVGVDQLADALWHDDPPLKPSASVRSIISRLRTQLGSDVIRTDGAGYRLDTTLATVDLAEVESVAADAHLQLQDPAQIRAALERWVGEPLADVSWTPAFEPERARIEELRASLRDGYHEAMLRHGRATETLADLARDSATAPLRESTQLLLMRALAAVGRTADALRAGNEYRVRLAEQTGIDPSADYDALVALLLSTDGSEKEDPAAGQVAVQLPHTPGTWVPPDNPFVGREPELLELGNLASRRRLVTITGPGGVGKTRLVTEYMSSHAIDPSTELHMVGLASLDRSGAVDTAVATALGIEAASERVLSALTDRLSARSSVLVLDNCEHVLSSTRALVQALLREVPGLRVLVTSRRRLGLSDEAILEVGPLAVPSDSFADSAPVRLFTDRVERAAPRLEISERDEAVCADICRLLDGLPLALEIAAARVAMFGFDGLRERLLAGLAVPSGPIATDERRQATIESTVEWSLELLGSEARELFDDLSVFPSWFDLAGLEAVLGGAPDVGALGEILDSSLLVVDHTGPTYRLLEPIRQVAARGIDLGRRGRIITRYLEWVGSVTESIDRLWMLDDRAAAQQLVISHHADIRWALNHFIETGDAGSHGSFAGVLARVLAERCDMELVDLCRVEVGHSLEGGLARLMLAWNQGDQDSSARLTEQLRREIGPGHRLWSYFNWVRCPVLLYSGETDALVEAASIAASDETAFGSMRSEAVALSACGLLYSGRADEAAAVLRENEEILGLAECGGFVSYIRAEVAAVDDPELAISYLSAASSEATAAMSSFTQRLTEFSQLVLLIEAQRTRDAATLALRLVPELIHAGTFPQAWTTLRHVAVLLGQLDAAHLGLLVLDSANADPDAPAVIGDGIDAETAVRRSLGQSDPAGGSATEPLALGELWENVSAVLAGAVLEGGLGRNELGGNDAREPGDR